jgi:hypothetical protein
MMKTGSIVVSTILFSGTSLLSCLPPNGEIDESFREKRRSAFAASTPVECRSSLQFCEKVLTVNPNHPVVNYLAAVVVHRML